MDNVIESEASGAQQVSSSDAVASVAPGAAAPADSVPAEAQQPVPVVPVLPYAQAGVPAFMPPVGFAPMAPAFVPPPGGVWSEGIVVGMVRDADPPSYCYKCGEPADGPPVKRYVRCNNDPDFLPLGVLGLGITLLSMFVQGKGTTVRISLCARHRRWRQIRVSLAITSFSLGVMALVLAAVGDLAQDALVGAILFGCGSATLGPIFFLAFWREASATFIDERVVKLSGAGQGFLARLPAFLPPGMVPFPAPYWQPMYYPPPGAYPPPQAMYPPGPMASPAPPPGMVQAPGCYGR